jgi:MurNAc alpha-1-phosphate uridylyltransferase
VTGTHAMILAAGLGTRMGQLSRTMPKPLVKVSGKSLLERLLAQARAAGVEKTIVNVHHLAEQIEDFLAAHPHADNIEISDERTELLETGGGVKKALPKLGEGPFFVMNGDALWVDNAKSNLQRLRESFDPNLMDVLLLLAPTEQALGYDGVGDFFAEAGAAQPIRFRDDAPRAPYMFAGVQLIDPALYQGTPAGPFSNREVFRKAASKGRLYGLPIEGHWMHVGTPEAIGAAEAKLAEIGAG